MLTVFVCTLTVAMLLVPGIAGAGTLYVAPNGNDAWSGWLKEPNAERTDGPLASLIGAREAIRRLKADGGLKERVQVSVGEGTYRMTEPFVLEPQDSGTREAPILYSGEPGARPIISGGRALTGWRRQGDRWIVELPEVKAGQWYFGALWVNGERRVRARTPNEGYFFTAGKAPPAKDPNTGQDVARENVAFQFNPGDIQAWENLEDAHVIVYHSWETSIHRVKSVDLENHLVEFTGPAAWAFESWGPKQRYHVENVPEALDAPGEWYLDRKTGVLSYLPREGEDLTTAEVIAPVAQQLVLFEGRPAEGQFVEHVYFENLRLLHTDWPIAPQGHSDGQAAFSVPAAVQAVGSRYCSVERCEIAHVGTYGVWWRMGCQDNRLVQCDLHDLGAGGVRIGEGGDPPTDAEAARLNVIDNNFIHDGGKVFRGGVGVWIGRSSYNTVSHNEVCDFDYSGMSVGWSWGYAPTSAHHNVLEYNHIHNIGRGVLNDMGAIYTLGISPGTVERYNLMHDIYCWVFGGWGVYTDEGSSDILIENNVVYNTSSGCFHQHYGKENLLRNNVFAFGREGVLRRSREEEHTSFLLEHNLVLAKGTPFLIVGWSNGHYQIDHNLYWDLAEPEPDFFGMDFADWQAEGRDPHSLIADPLCVDAEHYDFRLRPGSPAEKIGFMPIDLSKVGLYGDPEWVNAPQKVQRQPYVPPPPQPPPPPEPIAEGFEGTPVGEKAVGATTYEEGEVARIRVTDETGAASKYSLKFVDAPGLQYRFNPHLFYATNFTKGVLEENLDLRIEPGAIMYHEWRDSSNPYRVGPAFSVTEDGRLLARDRELARVPAGEWMHLTITCALGKEATGTFNLTVTLPGQEPRQFENLPCHPKFKQLRWFGFVADGDKSAVFYLDNLLLEPRAE